MRRQFTKYPSKAKEPDEVTRPRYFANMVSADTGIMASSGDMHTSIPVDNPVIYRLGDNDYYGYANDGARIESYFWDWCAMNIIVHNYMSEYGMSDSEAYEAFFADIMAYDPQAYTEITRDYAGSWTKTFDDFPDELDELRYDYLYACGFTEAPAEEDPNIQQ